MSFNSEVRVHQNATSKGSQIPCYNIEKINKELKKGNQCKHGYLPDVFEHQSVISLVIFYLEGKKKQCD